MDFKNHIAPFSWTEHDDGSASVTLYTSEKYKAKLFKTRKKEGFVGSGYDWESLAQVFIQENFSDLQLVIEFDSEHLMFCAYSSDLGALKRFILAFKETCENDKLIAGVFSRTAPQKPITNEDMQNVLKNIMNMGKE